MRIINKFLFLIAEKWTFLSDMDCSKDEYLAVTHPDYLYGNMLDYYMADPEEYGFNLSCIKVICRIKNLYLVDSNDHNYDLITKWGK